MKQQNSLNKKYPFGTSLKTNYKCKYKPLTFSIEPEPDLVLKT